MIEQIDYQYREGIKRIELNIDSEYPEIIPSAEKIILQIGGRTGLPYDLGALCYSKRECKTGIQWSKTGKRVVIDSLESHRIEFIIHVIRFLFESKYSLATMKNIAATLQTFVESCDGRDRIAEMFCKNEKGFDVFKNYFRVSSTSHDSKIWDLFCEYFEKHEMEGQLTTQPWYKTKDSNPTPPLLDEQVNAITEFNIALFEAGYELLVSKVDFPYQFDVPSVLNEPDNKYNLIPIRSQLHKRNSVKKNSEPTFDFIKNDWVTELDFASRGFSRQRLLTLIKRIKNDKAKVEEANKNPAHWSRIFFAELAMAAYRNLFVMLTGSNRSGLDGYEDYKDVPWGSDFGKKNFAKGYHKFTYQKGRAAFKKVEFMLVKEDSPLFYKYLKLRSNLIQAYGKEEDDCRYLFFSHKKNEFTSFEFNKNFFDYFPEIPKLTPQVARATKSDILLHTTNDVGTIASILQNDIQTVIRNYAKGTVRGHITEIGGFLQSVSEVVSDISSSKEIEIEVGNCDSFNEPKATEDIPETINQPDCSTKEGCLFCDKYRNHGDEKDVRKLLSYLYFLQEAEIGLSGTEQFEVFFKPVVERISEILNFIKSKSDGHERLVIRLEEEVLEEGELSEFFEQELDLRDRVRDIWDN